ncbi:TonB-dependent receptor [Flagellimonas crocea]|uniref:TonB-dependent receptor n=1 Tax=Flagellimonas crocea TaxID=3067311 RepID=UPI00296E7493|nr:TonB-dependent receptor [Muricauda sp. DH64]
MGKRLLFLIVCLIALHSKYTVAQTKTNLPLATILDTVQKRFDIQFNYVSDLVVDITLELPEDSLNLEQTLDYLRNKSKLAFVFIDATTISIREEALSFCGYVKDLDSEEPLPYVAIQIGNIGTYTNENGYFELRNLKRDNIVHIRHIGYKPLFFELNNLDTSNCRSIFMVPYQEKLDEITVYDFLVRGMDKLENGTYTLNFERFSTLPGLVEDDVLFSVQALPGVQSIDETVSNINIRGGSNDQNLITWDGIKMYQSGHFFGLISMYHPNITHHVELRKNGSDASQTDGVSGTIAMHTEEQLNNKIKGSIGANLIDVNSFIDIPIKDKLSFQLASRKSISDVLETPTYSSYFDRISQNTELDRSSSTITNSDFTFDFYDTSFRLLYRPSDKELIKINFIHTANEATFNEVAAMSGTETSRQSNIEQSSLAEGLQYQRTWSKQWSSDLAVYNTDYKLQAINANILENQRFLQENKVSETGLKLKVVNHVSSRTNWTGGYQLVETKVTNLDDVDNPLYLLLVGEVLRTHALFTQIGTTSKNGLSSLNVGLRFNYLTEFDKQLWEPRLSFNHQLNDYLSLEVLGEFKHQSTSQVINFQNDFLGLEKRRWQLANDTSIPVISSRQGSVGLLYSKKGWLLNGVTFFKKVNGITTQSQGFQNQYEYVKTAGSYAATGLDLLVKKQFRSNHVWLSYSLLNSDYTFDELPENSFANNFEISHALALGANYHLGPMVLAAGMNWHSGRPFTMPSADNPVSEGEINYDETNGENLTDYLRVDISGKYEIACGEHTSLEIGAAIWNIFDRNNMLNTFYELSESNTVQKFDKNSLGLTPNFSVRFTFN